MDRWKEAREEAQGGTERKTREVLDFKEEVLVSGPEFRFLIGSRKHPIAVNF